MKDNWMKIKEWWNRLALREKQAVASGGVFLAIFISYAGIWSPFTSHVNTMRSRIASQQKLLLWMQSADKEIQNKELQTKSNNKTVSSVVLLSLLQKQIDQAGLAQNLTQLKQVSNASIEMHLQKIEFDKLSSVLIAIAKEHNLAVTQTSLIPDTTPGIVNADIVLKGV